jgi:hypothetical protein
MYGKRLLRIASPAVGALATLMSTVTPQASATVNGTNTTVVQDTNTTQASGWASQLWADHKALIIGGITFLFLIIIIAVLASHRR